MKEYVVLFDQGKEEFIEQLKDFNVDENHWLEWNLLYWFKLVEYYKTINSEFENESGEYAETQLLQYVQDPGNDLFVIVVIKNNESDNVDFSKYPGIPSGFDWTTQIQDNKFLYSWISTM